MIYADPDSQFVLINNLFSVQLILTILMITYGLNRIFRHAQSAVSLSISSSAAMSHFLSWVINVSPI